MTGALMNNVVVSRTLGIEVAVWRNLLRTSRGADQPCCHSAYIGVPITNVQKDLNSVRGSCTSAMPSAWRR